MEYKVQYLHVQQSSTETLVLCRTCSSCFLTRYNGGQMPLCSVCEKYLNWNEFTESWSSLISHIRNLHPSFPIEALQDWPCKSWGMSSFPSKQVTGQERNGPLGLLHLQRGQQLQSPTTPPVRKIRSRLRDCQPTCSSPRRAGRPSARGGRASGPQGSPAAQEEFLRSKLTTWENLHLISRFSSGLWCESPTSGQIRAWNSTSYHINSTHTSSVRDNKVFIISDNEHEHKESWFKGPKLKLVSNITAEGRLKVEVVMGEKN